MLLIGLFAVTGPCGSDQAQRPETNPRGAYVIEVSVDGSEFKTQTIGNPDFEAGCEIFAAHEDAERTCNLATNLTPTLIGGEAYGDLNDRRTPALDALIWRARADADPSICDRGGLVGEFLSECVHDASDPKYLYEAGAFRVRVPIGGALPHPTG